MCLTEVIVLNHHRRWSDVCLFHFLFGNSFITLWAENLLYSRRFLVYRTRQI